MADRPEIKVTAGAQRALGLAELVNKVLGSQRVPAKVPGHPGYRVEMSGPEGPSTSEGKGGRDHLRLVPVGQGGSGDGSRAAIIIATADPSLSQVELRTYAGLVALHAQRFKGEALPIDAADYEALRKKVAQFFERQGIDTVDAAAPPSRAAAAASAASGPKKPPALALVAVGVALLIAVIAFVLRSK